MITNRWAICLLLFITTLVMSSSAILAQQKPAPSELTATLRTDHFVVRYNPGDPYLANLMGEIAERELLRISKKLRYTPDKNYPFPLRIYKSHRSFIRQEGILNKYTVGTAQSGSGAIALDASGGLMFPEEPLAHEITHAVIFRILGHLSFELPLWFNEGLAKLESGASEGRDHELIGDAAAEGSIMPLSDLARAFPENRVDLAYAQSASAVRLFVNTYGASAPRELLHRIAQSGSFDEAMRQVTGNSSENFMKLWYDDTTERYWAWRFMRIATAMISITMALLAVLAFIARRRRMIAAAKQWQQEEFEEALRRQQGNDWSI